MDRAAERVRREVGAIAGRGGGWVEMARDLGRVLQRVIPTDRQCWHTIDPDTLLFTAAVAENLPPEPRLPHHEYAIPDVNSWVALARTGATVGILSRATHGRPEISARYRGLLEPYGIAHEMRASFVAADGACWGAMSFFRDRGRPDFTDEEAALLRSVAGPIADGFRRSFLVAQVLRADEPEAPGLVLFGPQGPESITPSARDWLEDLKDEHDLRGTQEVPYVVAAIAARARLEDPRAAPPKARARGRSGRWLLLYGTPLEGGRVAVIIEPARPDEVAPMILRAYGLSQRERQVTLLCLRGLSTKEAAAALVISENTVQDHLKSIFDKMGMRSRRELAAHIFMEQYQPRFAPIELDRPWMGAGIPAFRAGPGGVEDPLPPSAAGPGSGRDSAPPADA